MIELHGVWKGFGKQQILEEISLNVDEGDRLCIIGQPLKLLRRHHLTHQILNLSNILLNRIDLSSLLPVQAWLYEESVNVSLPRFHFFEMSRIPGVI